MPPLNVTLSFHQIDFGAGVPVFELQALGLNQDDAGEVNLVLPHRNFVMCIGTRSWNVAIILTSWAYEVSVAVHLPVESEAVERGGGGGSVDGMEVNGPFQWRVGLSVCMCVSVSYVSKL